MAASIETSHTPSHSKNEPIAIIGSGCRFPGGANSSSKLWELLRDPRDVLREIPPSRFDVNGFYHPDPSFPGHMNVKHSYILEEDVAQFDAQFFSLTPAEAAAMDPQQRLLLEAVYEGLETAGLTMEGLRGSDTGVYVGQMYGDYESLQFRDLQHIPTYLAIGTGRSILSNRVSYFFDWHGPSMTVDTACSSSLVALHGAVQALRSGEVQVALAAGSNLLLGPEPYIHESKLKMLSPDGRSRMWDKDANGYARGDGVAAVILKTLSAAIADGDNIDCVIREIGVNQDGRSRGITMPSVTAQATLIQETYARAGLDPKSSGKDGRCQYFEAHGTGTPAGDPVEAEAIQTAFFPNEEHHAVEDVLYVGSIKTVIGHTESTAGIAGVLKAMQALKHGYIPPNMLLNNLNPAVLPFYDHLHIPQTLIPWPKLPEGSTCRRASVNGFGFGGTNAHVILESFAPSTSTSSVPVKETSTLPLTPFLFSAQSKQSLLANLTTHAQYLEEHREAAPSDLAWTLRSRRSRLPLRVSFPASSTKILQSNLEKLIQDFHLDSRSAANTLASRKKPRILGIFTGQGAQWARMGAELIENDADGIAAKTLAKLDATLAQLPTQDRPPWTLRQELLAEPSLSRVNSAAISQPLCTAIQIVLVEILRQAGISFAAVVGHSSGEIGAAFAAGHVTADAAIRIAYYRGLHSHLACGPNGLQGAMLAAGTSLEDAQELCDDEEFKGRVKVAACNSPSSVTLSGDEDAIAEIADILDDENKFYRLLKVDKAYHSHHMLPCSQPYLDSMAKFPSERQTPESNCTWVSSVYPDRSSNGSPDVRASYWVENLLSPVFFQQALQNVMSLGPFDGVIEVGPHPALKGPVNNTLQSIQDDIPYTALLNRNTNAIDSISAALGYLWTHLDNLAIDFDRYEKAMGGPSSHHFISDLPTYQWNHSQSYWNESDMSRNLRQRSTPVHPLLGDLSPHSSAHQLSWKNILRPQDLPWVHDHRIQGQTVFPAAGYVVTALETVPFFVGENTVQVVEIEDLRVHQAMVFDNDDIESGIEVRSTVSSINREDTRYIRAQFTYEACTGNQQVFQLVASGEILIIIGEPSPLVLPATISHEPYMIDVPEESLYSSLADVGYGYTGPFKSLFDMKRKLGKASGSIAMTTIDYNEGVLAVHPAVLDAAFHSIILAFSYPQDGLLRALHLPTHVRRIRINPSLCGNQWVGVGHASFVATVLDAHGATGFTGDVEIHDSTGEHSAIQVEGLHVVPFTPATPEDDQKMFHATHWIDAEPNAEKAGSYLATAEEKEMAIILERGSYFYLRQLEHQIPSDHPGRFNSHYSAYLNFALQTHKKVIGGNHRYVKKEWLNDNLEDIIASSEKFSDRPEVKAMHAVGENMPRAIRGETDMLEHLMMNGLLDDYYAKALSITKGADILAETVHQISQRYPHARILEVGSGTGGATRQILKRLGNDFSTFTFTDVSAGFFSKAKSEFALFEDRMIYSILDLEQEVQTQGFEQHSYDLIVASFVLHATKSLEQTVRRVRSLLKPGGYLIMYEVTNVDIVRGTALFGCLPGWWMGMDEGRTLGAAVTESKWDAILRKTGFSGIDTMTPIQDAMAFPNSVLVSQAVDEWVEFIREPLIARPTLFSGKSAITRLFIVGGSTLRVSRLIEDVQKLIKGFCDDITRVEKLADLDHDEIESDSTILVLEDLDHHVFENITEACFNSLKLLFGSEKAIFWVTENRLIDNPYSNMPVGFARSALWEVPELRYQFFDLQDVYKIDARVLVEALLRFQASGSVQEQSQRNTLWSVESEIIIDSDERQLIPRLRAVEEANDRYNSARRTITKKIQPQACPVEIFRTADRYILREKSVVSSANTTADFGNMVVLKLTHSTLRAVGTLCGDAFLVLGTCSTNNTQYLALTHSTASISQIPQTHMIDTSVAPQVKPVFLECVVANLLLPNILWALIKGDTIIVHDAPAVLARILSSRAKAIGITVFYTSSSRLVATEKNWLHVDKYLRHFQLKLLLPSKAARFIDFTNLDERSAQSALVASCLAPNTHIINALDLFRSTAEPLSCTGENASAVSQVLKVAQEAALLDLATCEQACGNSGKVNILDLIENQDSGDLFTIIDWDAPSLTITIQPAETQFKPDRTYWLVGLSGDLGLSIADWMIKNGARTLVITSRNPKVDTAWLESATHKGAVVKVIQNDLIDYAAVQETYREICATLPPVAGVAQGAMILKDVATRDMKLEQLNQVTRPKVDGSLNLDNMFSEDSLDFFIFFASAANVAGNPGQANYTAANLFMSGLAQQRRHKGLSASVVDLGLIIGTGYITREKGDTLTRPSFDRGLLTISESDVHQTLAEAVNASRPESGPEWHISTGLRLMPSNAPNRPLWYTYPQFACLTVRDVAEATTTTTGTGAPIKEQLANATSKECIERIITGEILRASITLFQKDYSDRFIDTFIDEMRKMLHMNDDYEIKTSSRTDELGLDSLVAVRIRSWFLNNYQVNIPALKILKGASLQELIEQALEEVPLELTPGISTEHNSEPDSEVLSRSLDSLSEGSDTSHSSDAHTEGSSIEDDSVTPKYQDTIPQEDQIQRFGRLSFTQSVFMFVHSLLSDKSTLNNTGMLQLKGSIRIPDLEKAVRSLGQRHESLRTCFYERNGRLYQGVLKSSSLTLERKEIASQDALYQEYSSLRNHVYDMARGQMSRIMLLSYSSSDHYLLLGSHHIIFDRGSNDAVMADLELAYNGYQPGPEPLQYLDYSNEQHIQFTAGFMEEALSFWRSEFISLPDPLPLHRSKISERYPMERYFCHEYEFRINNQKSATFRQTARKYRSTPFHVHLAAFKVLLQRFLGISDICIGIADNCRRDSHMRTGIGPFLNMLPLRMTSSAEQSFGDAIAEAREKSLLVLTNSIPLEVILNELKVPRASTHSPLTQAFMNYAENDTEDGNLFLGCTMNTIKQNPAEIPHDITFTVINNTSGDTHIILNVQASLYSLEDTRLIAQGYEDILQEFASTPEQSVGDEWCFRQPALQKALTVGRGPAFDSTWRHTLMHQFEESFPRVAHRVAVTDGQGSSVTYRELSNQINQIASELLRKGVKPNSKVAIFQHPTVHWVASVLSILKVGAVYVPLDAGNPVARLSFIVGDCQPTVILVHENTIAMSQGLAIPRHTTIINISDLAGTRLDQIAICSQPSAAAIILYTSGSTGVPKGVVLSHSSLKHEFDHCAATYGLGEHDVVLQQSAWSFDVSVTQIFLALGAGARLHMVSHLMRTDTRAIAELIVSERVTATYATPTEYKSWLRREHQNLLRSSSWRLSLVAGEAVTEPLLQLFRELNCPGLRLFNVYGPTETTCGSTKMELEYRTPGAYPGTIPVGKPSANECFYILDEKQNLQPVGQTGEITIGGIGVALGYLDNGERTQTSFLPDPFANEDYLDHGWKTMYRTGDSGYLQPDGTLILQGRIGGDTEIKLNGIRIDLREIEQTILRAANGTLADAVCTVRSSQHGSIRFMVVHVIFSAQDVSMNQALFLQTLLEGLPLPRAMLPSALIPVETFPRGLTGKVDRRGVAALSIPRRIADRADDSCPLKSETVMKGLWEIVIPDELLNLHHIDSTTDFFTIGGSSMLLIELQYKIQENLNISIPLLKLFQSCTLRSMAQLLDMNEEVEGNDQICWTAETKVQSELDASSTRNKSAPKTNPAEVVLLTGVTGFIGQYLLNELLAREHVKKVICIAIRNFSDERKTPFSNLDGVECYEGDLTQPRLGLTEEDSLRIFQEVDSVIHNGADVSHLKTYSSLRPANVGSTEELVKLCLPRNIPLHYISTTGVTMYTTSQSFAELSVRHSEPPTDGLYGYILSKWASEVYLENVNARFGLPVYIHRPSSVIRPETEMMGDSPAADVLQNMLAFSQHLRAVPSVPGLQGYLDLVRPDTVSRKVVDAVMGHESENEIVYIHESGDLELDITQIRDYLTQQTGKNVEEISLSDWILRAEQIGLTSSMAAVFQAIGKSEQMNFPKLLRA